MTAALVETDDSLLSKLDRGLYRVESALALVSGLGVLALMFLAVYSVGGRILFNAPMPGYIDWIEQLMPLIAFLGVAFVHRDGGHVRMDMAVNQLKGRALWTTELITTLFILALITLLIWGAFAHFGRSFEWTAPLFSHDSTIDIGLPTWPAKLIVPAALSVLFVRLLLQCVCYARGISRNQLRPIGVPLPQSLEEIAQETVNTSTGYQKDGTD